MKRVDSSAISAVGYRKKDSTMYVDWIKGGRYEYPGVEAEVHDALMSSNSHGETMNYIKRSYPARKV